MDTTTTVVEVDVNLIDNVHKNENQDLMKDIFNSQGSVNARDLPDFHSIDLTTVTNALLNATNCNEDLEIHYRSTSTEQDEEELAEFLLDTLSVFESIV